jgi:GAF domain-containing protein
MGYLLFWLTTLINVLGLALALCLGLYVVTRTPRGRLTWIAALTLWSLAAFYLYNALAATVPGNRALPWLRPTVVLALAFGFHLSLLLPSGRYEPGLRFLHPPLNVSGWMERLLGSASAVVRQVPVPLSYAAALILIAVGAIPLGGPVQPSDGPALYLSDRAPTLLYPLAIFYLVVVCALAFLHHWQVWRQEPHRQRKRQTLALLIAIVLTLCGGVYLGLGVWLQADIPSFPGDVAVGIAALVFGYRVARYTSLAEGLVLRRELLYILMVIGLFTIGYVVAAEILYQGGHVFSAMTLIVIVMVGVTSLMLYDGMRAALDRLFYRQQFRQLRGNLRALAREASMGQSLPERLQYVLSGLCNALRVGQGFVALREAEAYRCQAAEQAECLGQAYALADLEAYETVELPRADGRNPEGMSLLVPLYAVDEQIGALLLGPRESGRPYTEEDLMLLDDVADQLSVLISAAQEQEENAQLISQMVAEFREREHSLQRQMQQMLTEHEEEARPVLEGFDEAAFAALVEDALRKLHDYTYLGEHDLAGLRVVAWYLPEGDEGFVTHIDRGKAVSQVLTESIEKLRPAGEEPAAYTVPQRSWHQYLVLYEAYVLGELNRDIMSKLYISEGTFNRTRRRAIRGVAKALQEMEQEAQEREKA